MPQVIVVIGAVLAGVASVVGAAISTVVAIISTIVVGVAAIIAPIIAEISAALTTVLGPILGPINDIGEFISESILEPINVIGSQILGPVKDIERGIDSAIATLTIEITPLTEPVLRPIIDTLAGIKDYTGGVNDIIIDELEPVTETAQIVRSLSSIKMTRQLLAGTQSLADVLGSVADTAGLETATAISGLWRDVVTTTTGVLTVMDDHYVAINTDIKGVEGRLITEQEAGLEAVTETLETSIASVEEEFSGETQRLRREVAIIERRTEDIPEFQKMLIKALT